MADSNFQLNQLLIEISRCLLQYAGECWPWTSTDPGNEKKAAIDRLVDQQRHHVAGLAELLVDRRQVVDFGTYPVEFTDLHFVSLDFLSAQLVDNQQQLIDRVANVVASCSGDQDAMELLQQIEAGEREILDELKKLVELSPTPST